MLGLGAFPSCNCPTRETPSIFPAVLDDERVGGNPAAQPSRTHAFQKELFRITETRPSIITKSLMLTATAGLSLLLTSCTADEPDTAANETTSETPGVEPSTSSEVESLRPAPEVGDPIPAAAFANLPETMNRTVDPDEYEFLYRTVDGSLEYYRGPESRGLCLVTVEIANEHPGFVCSSGDAVGGPTYRDGVLINGAMLAATPPDDDLNWANPLEDLYVIDIVGQ